MLPKQVASSGRRKPNRAKLAYRSSPLSEGNTLCQTTGVMLFTDDVARLAAFYRDKLGFTMDEDRGESIMLYRQNLEVRLINTPVVRVVDFLLAVECLLAMSQQALRQVKWRRARYYTQAGWATTQESRP